MIADIYISKESFEHNGVDNIVDVVSKLNKIHDVINIARRFSVDNNLLLYTEKFKQVQIFGDGQDICGILSNYQDSVEKYNKDIVTLLFGILKFCKNSTAQTDDLIEYLSLYNKDNCNAILVLNPIEGQETNVQIFSDLSGWYQFRRYFLSLFPGDKKFFLKESQKYFPDIKIHPSVEQTIDNVLATHSKQIVRCLSILNDHLLPDYKTFKQDLIIFLSWFKNQYKFDDVSMQGHKDKKTFELSFDDGTIAYCEPHVKMYKDDNKNENHHCRIHFKCPSLNDKLVYVGIICTHT